MRTAVREFGKEMEQKLQENDHKDPWTVMSPLGLLVLLENEVHELKAAIIGNEGPRAVTRECADVANIAMFIAEVAGDLGQFERRGM